jgi:uncharacterized membrane protein
MVFVLEGPKFQKFCFVFVGGKDTVAIKELRISHGGIENKFHGKSLFDLIQNISQLKDLKLNQDKVTFITDGQIPLLEFGGIPISNINFEPDYGKIFRYVFILLCINTLLFLLLFNSAHINSAVQKLAKLPGFSILFQPQKLFLIIALFWGSINVFLIPPFEVADEGTHFLRIFHISSGHFIAETKNHKVGGYVPSSLVQIYRATKYPYLAYDKSGTIQKTLSAFSIPLNPEIQSFEWFTNSAQYAPVPYLPQVIAITIPRLFHAPPLFLFYLGRLGNLAIWILLIYFAIRITPVLKWLFVVVAFIPMNIFQASSLSADGLTNSMALLVTAFIFRLAFDPDYHIDRKKIVLLIFFAVIFNFCKNAYFSLILLYFLIPKNKLARVGNYYSITAIVLSFIGIAVIAGSIYVKQVFQHVDLAVGMFPKGLGFPENVNPYAQFSGILANPIQYGETIINTFAIFGKTMMVSFVGMLGWGEIMLPDQFVYFTFFMLFFVAITDHNENIIFKTYQKTILAATGISTILILLTLLYLSWTTVGSDLINGTAGRYFIPVAPIIFAIFINRKLNLQPNIRFMAILIFITSAFFEMNIHLLKAYY